MTRTASCYTHKVQVVSTAQNLKVEYPGKVAVTPQPLAPTLPCYPSFTPITYIPAAKCQSHKPVCLQPPSEFLYQWTEIINGPLPPNSQSWSFYQVVIGSSAIIYVSILDLSGTNQSAYLLSVKAGYILTFSSNSATGVWTATEDATINGSYVTIKMNFITNGPGSGPAIYPHTLFTYSPP